MNSSATIGQSESATTSKDIQASRFAHLEDNTYRLVLYDYYGDARELGEGTIGEMRDRVFKKLSHERKSRPIIMLDRGWRWEVCESDDNAGLVPPHCGVLEIQCVSSPIEVEWDDEDWLELADDATREQYSDLPY